MAIIVVLRFETWCSVLAGIRIAVIVVILTFMTCDAYGAYAFVTINLIYAFSTILARIR